MFFKRQLDGGASREAHEASEADKPAAPTPNPEEMPVQEDSPLQAAPPPWQVMANERPVTALLHFQVRLEGKHVDRSLRTVEVEVGAPDEDYAVRLARVAWLTAAGAPLSPVMIHDVRVLGEAARCGVMRANLVSA